jgi:hypothetical protein
MKTHLHSIALIATLGAASLGAQTAAAVPAYPAAPAAPAAQAAPAAKPTSFTEALTMGKVSVNARLRYEHIDQPTTRADALTVRTRLGYKTASYLGLQAFIEGENTTALVDQFNPDPTAPSAKSVVADPDVTDVSQAWLGYTYDKTGLTAGRQKVVLDNSRWVGDVGWRQSGQSFDSVFVKDNTFKDLSLTYGYVWNVKRWFADTVRNPDFESNSHILNAGYKVSDYGTLTGYGYLLDFESSKALTPAAVTDNSSATYGASFVGAAPVTDSLKATYRAEYATQSDYGSNTTPYTADYYIAELGAALKSGYALKFGYEVLGQDGSSTAGNAAKRVIRTPIATQHAHNGWADLFLATPAGGLVDSYVSLAVPIPGGVTLTTIYHKFEAETGSAEFGDEIDVVATYKVNKNLNLTAKTAYYNGAGDSTAPVAVRNDKTVYWLQADYAF